MLDLLSEADIRAVLREAHRVLAPGGLLCLATLTVGQGPASQTVCRIWQWLHALRPQLVGGCRPLQLMPFLEPKWAVTCREVVCAFAVCAEVMVAER